MARGVMGLKAGATGIFWSEEMAVSDCWWTGSRGGSEADGLVPLVEVEVDGADRRGEVVSDGIRARKRSSSVFFLVLFLLCSLSSRVSA